MFSSRKGEEGTEKRKVGACTMEASVAWGFDLQNSKKKNERTSKKALGGRKKFFPISLLFGGLRKVSEKLGFLYFWV